jgi:hypothetical protein
MTNRVKHIAKLFIFLTTVLLLAGSRYAYAQENTGSNPYLESEHAYAVNIGKAANAKRWIVTDKNGHSHQITTTNEDTFDWFDIEPATTNGTNEIVTIFFDRDIFAPGGSLIGTWYLQYFEDQEQSDGSTVCVSAREYELTVTENEFYLTLADDASQCNGQDGAVHTIADVTNNDYATTVTYTVVMHKETDYNPDQFNFVISFDQPVDAGTVSTAVDPSTEGTATFSANTDSTVTVIPVGSNNFTDEVTIDVTATFSNNVLSETIPALTVSSGEATVNGTPPAITYDNEEIHPVGNPGDRTQAITIYELPATSDIGPGAGETVASATNPLQNSTHNYLVTMEDQSNNTGTWSVENDEDTPMTEGTGASDHYSLTPTNAGNDVTAAITFTENMPTGIYTIKFEEENTTGCSTLRAYDVDLGEPLNVSIALANAADAERCPDVSGTVVRNDELNNATTNIIEYTVTLNTTGYGAAWSFDMGIISDEGFATSDVDVAGSGINVTGGAFTGADNYSGTVSVAAGVTEVTIAVTYEGFYVNEHDITVLLTNIEGTYNDEADDVNVSNIINAMPQPLALEGVD